MHSRAMLHGPQAHARGLLVARQLIAKTEASKREGCRAMPTNSLRRKNLSPSKGMERRGRMRIGVIGAVAVGSTCLLSSTLCGIAREEAFAVGAARVRVTR
jgi:hypothetical protein